ncbi:MAG TPA: response regulator [Pyrinomonadaceae bacterium]|jgi:ActR/RegA family two-component response regulator
MRRKRVLVVEDVPGIRVTYARELSNRGFDVYSAGTVKEARYLIGELGETVDVALLDMRLENDPDEPNTNGAELGLELKEKCASILPEFLIRSAYADFAYFKAAFELGAAAYLKKNDTYPADVIRHVRALMLKHYVKGENPEVEEGLRRIAAVTRNTTDSIKSFCENILAPAMGECLGAPFVLLLSDRTGTQNCAGAAGTASGADMPLTSERVYHVIQAITHGNADPLTPYVLDANHVREHAASKPEERIIDDLDGAAFISLADLNDPRNEYRLTLGILKADWAKYAEAPEPLAAVVARYVRTTVSENFIKILVHIDTKRKSTLGNTAQLCLFVGQDQAAIVDEGAAAGDLRVESPTHRRLGDMAEDLRDTGVVLMNVAKSVAEEDVRRIRMAELVRRTWEELKKSWRLKGIEFDVEGECFIVANEQDVVIIVERILQWLAQRKVATESPNEPAIRVRCEADESISRVIFEDRSRRLSPRLRERLFEPFTLAAPPARHLNPPRPDPQGEAGGEAAESRHRPSYLPLYLAKTLVEEKYWGWLEDRSDDMAGDVGHRLAIQLHKSFESEVAQSGKR